MQALLRLYAGTIKALGRLFSGSNKVSLRTLAPALVKALLRLYAGSIEGVVRLFSGSNNRVPLKRAAPTPV